MLTIRAHGGHLCDGIQRRTMLQAGGLGALGLGMSQLPVFAAAGGPENLGRTSAGQAKSCIILFLLGGSPQHSTFDPKPDAPAEVRGSFGPVGLVVSGGAVGAESIGATGTAQSYQNVLVGIIGTQVSFAGFTVGGLISGGKANYASTSRTNQSLGFSNPASGATTSYGNGAPLRPLPSDGNNDTLFLWQIGAMYTVGPVSVGVAYHEVSYEGSTAASSNARDRGLGIGGSYAVAPGVNMYAEYLYGRREENGVNLQTGQLGTDNNKTTANVFGLGVAFNW